MLTKLSSKFWELMLFWSCHVKYELTYKKNYKQLILKSANYLSKRNIAKSHLNKHQSFCHFGALIFELFLDKSAKLIGPMDKKPKLHLLLTNYFQERVSWIASTSAPATAHGRLSQVEKFFNPCLPLTRQQQEYCFYLTML